MRVINCLISIAVVILSLPVFVFAEINVDDEKAVRAVVSEFLVYYREREFDKLSDLIDMSSPLMLYGAELTGELGRDLLTTSVSEAITFEAPGDANVYHFNIDFIKQRFSEYPYGWIKADIADIKEIEIISGKGILVIMSIFDNGVNPGNGFYAVENNNFRIVLTKKNGIWKIAGIAHVFGKVSDDPYFLVFDSDLKVQEGNFKEALQGFRDALVRDPNISYAHFGLALLYLRDRSLIDKDPNIGDKIFEEVEKAIKIRGDVPFYHYFLGRMYEARGNKGRAEEEYSSALRLDADFPILYWSQPTASVR